MRLRELIKTPIYFRSLLFKTTALISVVIIALSYFLYYNFSNYGIEIINKSNEKLLSEVSNNAMQINNYIQIYSKSLLTNENAVKLLIDNNISLFDTQSCIKKLDNTLSSIPFVYSAYFYNGNIDTYYTVGPDPLIRKKEAFFDKEINTILDNIAGYMPLRPIARQIAAGDNKPQESYEVYTYILPNYIFEKSELVNAIIINVKVDWIFNIIKSFNKYDLLEGNNIMIIDNKGMVLGDSQDKQYLKNLANIPYIDSILKSGKPAGYIMAKIENKQSIITYVNVEQTNWTLLSITPYNSVLDSINKVKFISLLICIIMLFLGIFSSFILSRQLYSPVRSLQNKMQHMLNKQTSMDKDLNEFDSMSEDIENTISKLSSLEAFKYNNSTLLKQEFLKKVLLNKISFTGDFSSECDERGLQIDNSSRLGVLIIKMDHYSDTFSKIFESSHSLYSFILSNIAGEIIFKQYKCEPVDMGDDHIAVVFNLDNSKNKSGDFNDTIKCLAEEIQEACKINLDFTVSVGVGQWCANFESLHKSYKTALDASMYRIIFGHECIVFWEELLLLQTGQFDISNDCINDFLETLKSGKFNELEEIFSKIIILLRKCDYNNIVLSLSHLTSSIFNTLNSIEKNTLVSLDVNYISFSNHINRLETLEEIHAEFTALFNTIIRKLLENRDNKSSIITENIINYIKINYCDPNLSINTIADIFNLSTAYIGKLFREYTSQSVSDYINDFRLDKAQELLLNTNLTIDEIIYKIKWENKNYFYTLFKKRFSATPTQYRLKASISKIHTND